MDCRPDPTGPDFFYYDITWFEFTIGAINPKALAKATGVTVSDLAGLRRAAEIIFERAAPRAIAVKTYHAYFRTLAWSERSDAEVERVLQKQLKGQQLDQAEALALGDWGLACGVELAIRHNLPFKIHTGYMSNNNYMELGRLAPGLLCPLLRKYPKARFELFHMAYPYQFELAALAKHYSNVWVDMCWAWALDPYGARDFTRRMIHSVPDNKLFLFGGDSLWPSTTVAYAAQARRGLTAALEAEVDDGLMTEKEAIALASRYMLENQKAFFDLEGKAAANRAALASGA